MPQHSPRSSIGSDDMRPTVEAQILDTKDALILVQRCLESKLFPITRRPHDRERAYLVKAGNVFIYTEEVSGIKRWTDGINWSPSRILNNFLVYRELEHAFPPGEKKKATKRTKRYDPYSRDRDRAHQLMNHHLNPPNHETIHVAGASRALTREEERLLVGSLNESYSFKHDGLIKKTISLNFQGQTWHIVWYFTYFAHIDGHFTRPSERWPETIIHPGLIQEQNFRCPLNADGTEPTSSAGPRERQARRSSLLTLSDIGSSYQQNNVSLNNLSPKQKGFPMPANPQPAPVFPQYASSSDLFQGHHSSQFPRQSEQQDVHYYGAQQPSRFAPQTQGHEYPPAPFPMHHLEPNPRQSMPAQCYMSGNSMYTGHSQHQLPSIQPQLNMHQPRGNPLVSPHHYRTLSGPQQYQHSQIEFDNNGHSSTSSPNSTTQVHMPHIMATAPNTEFSGPNSSSMSNLNEDPAMPHDASYPYSRWSRN